MEATHRIATRGGDPEGYVTNKQAEERFGQLLRAASRAQDQLQMTRRLPTGTSHVNHG